MPVRDMAYVVLSGKKSGEKIYVVSTGALKRTSVNISSQQNLKPQEKDFLLEWRERGGSTSRN